MGAKKKSKDDAQVAAAPDPREPLPPTPANLAATVKELRAVLVDVPPPPEPKLGDWFEAMLHIAFAEGLPCGIGQEARRRIAQSYVDRNEFRVTEAYEVEDLLSDLSIPNLFDRCLAVREATAQVYNDQNGVTLDFLREAGISDRNLFFQRAPALKPPVVAFLANMLTMDELCFSDRSTLRAQQRIGIEPKDTAVITFTNEVRELLKPYGNLPLDVGKHLPLRKPNLTHTLSPAALLVRLAPGGRRR